MKTGESHRKPMETKAFRAKDVKHFMENYGKSCKKSRFHLLVSLLVVVELSVLLLLVNVLELVVIVVVEDHVRVPLEATNSSPLDTLPYNVRVARDILY